MEGMQRFSRFETIILPACHDDASAWASALLRLTWVLHVTTMKGHTQLQRLRDPMRSVDEEAECLWRDHVMGGAAQGERASGRSARL